jgi:hypothetical protein
MNADRLTHVAENYFVPDTAGFGQPYRSLYTPLYCLHITIIIGLLHRRPSQDAFSSPKKPDELGRLPAHPASYSVGSGGGVGTEPDK